MNLSDSSKRMSRLSLTDKDHPDMKKHTVGSKHKFTVEAELVRTGKVDTGEYPDMGMVYKDGKMVKPAHSMTGEYRIHSITPIGAKDKTQAPPRVKAKKVAPKGTKVARYKNRVDSKPA